MTHQDLYQLRDTFNQNSILLCFNGPFSQGLIEELGNALKRYLQSESAPSCSSMDVFAAYVEIAQNIQQYSGTLRYQDSDASATVVISRDAEGSYVISAGNIVEPEDGAALVARIETLAGLDKAQLKSLYKEQLRKPRTPETASAGLGLIDIARKASAPMSCSLLPLTSSPRCFFSLSVII